MFFYLYAFIIIMKEQWNFLKSKMTKIIASVDICLYAVVVLYLHCSFPYDQAGPRHWGSRFLLSSKLEKDWNETLLTWMNCLIKFNHYWPKSELLFLNPRATGVTETWLRGDSRKRDGREEEGRERKFWLFQIDTIRETLLGDYNLVCYRRSKHEFCT